MDTKRYYEMTIDQLDEEIRNDKAMLKALERLMETRRLFGEKTKRQIEKKKANNKADICSHKSSNGLQGNSSTMLPNEICNRSI